MKKQSPILSHGRHYTKKILTSMSAQEKTDEKYKVDEPRKLKSWEQIAKKEIKKWLDDESYREEIMRTTLSKDENQPGPFTCFLYHFAFMCECGWGVMVDFDDYRQRIFLPDHYYKWMHKLRDEIINTQPPKP